MSHQLVSETEKCSWENDIESLVFLAFFAMKLMSWIPISNSVALNFVNPALQSRTCITST